MIRDLDASLRKMIQGEARPGSELAGATLSFAVPDKDWRNQGSGLELDIYLYRVMDNRELRSNARRPTLNDDGTITSEPFPARVECSYIISAWNKASEFPGLAKEDQEHRLLSQTLYVLWRNPEIPAKYLQGLLANAEIAPPLLAAESEDMAAKPDFWSGLETYARPAITCRVTIALGLDNEVTAPQATTLLGTLMPTDELNIIAGVIRNAAFPDRTVPAAWIQLDGSPRTYVSDGDGRYIIDRIAMGPHTLKVRAVGFFEANRAIQVPDPSGFYDVNLTPL
jgi:uncharacterized protein DUF4255